VFQIFTGPTPREVAAGQTSALLPFDELASDGDPATVFLRVVALGDRPGAPTLTLHTDRTPPLVLTPEFAALVAADGTVIADAAVAAEGDDTYRVRIVTHQLGTGWSLTITNPDATPTRYVGVVADNRDQTRQPWIDVPPSVGFEAGVAVPVTHRLPVHNLGTGELRLSTPPVLGTSPFTLALPPPIPPNGRADLGITFTPTTVGTTTFTLVLPSNDSAADARPGHNNEVSLPTRSRWLPPQTLLVLATQESTATLSRVDPETGHRTPVATFPRLTPSFPIVYDLAVEDDGSVLVLRADVPTSPDGGFERPWDAVDRVNPATGQVTTLLVGSPLEGPVAGVVDPSGQLLVAAPDAQPFGGALLRVDPATGKAAVLAAGDIDAPAPSFVFPRTLALAPDGALWVCASQSPSAPRVFRVDTRTGDMSTVYPGADLSLMRMVADAEGRLVFSGNDGLLRADLTTGQHTVLVPPPVETHDLLLDPTGRIITSTENGDLVGLHPDTGAFDVLSAAPVVPDGHWTPMIDAVGIVPWDRDAPAPIVEV
jgi:hypothetical protein